jgi:carbonic anhydrase/acetyltransferase-like protein (isoleucine patch superfamily)
LATAHALYARLAAGPVARQSPLITEGKAIPDRSLVVGSPGRVVRTLSDDEAARLRAIAAHYVDHARHYLRRLTADTRCGDPSA